MHREQRPQCFRKKLMKNWEGIYIKEKQIVKGMVTVLNIKPISEMRNVEENELDRLKATTKLLTKLEEGEQSAREKGWLEADEVETALGL